MAKKTTLLTALSYEVFDQSEEKPVLPFVNFRCRHLICGLAHRIVSFVYNSSLLHYYKVARRDTRGLLKIVSI